MSIEGARSALRSALEALIERGETVKVWPAAQGVTTEQLFDLATEIRDQLRPEANVGRVRRSVVAVGVRSCRAKRVAPARCRLPTFFERVSWFRC